MSGRRGKILGIVLFILLILALLYLTLFSVQRKTKGMIEMIEIKGNNLLSEGDYLIFSKLNDISNYDKLSLPVIKDRLEKHPYVQRADAALEDYNKIKVIITEKKIMAVVLSGSEPYFISESFQVLPLFTNTHFGDLPVISNTKENDKLKPLSVFQNDDMVQAFKIIDAAKLTNVNFLKMLSEINLRNGGDVLLTFSGVKPPVIFGRGEEAKKMVYLEMLWDGIIEGKNFTEDSDYIDLRFSNEIFIGGLAQGIKQVLTK